MLDCARTRFLCLSLLETPAPLFGNGHRNSKESGRFVGNACCRAAEMEQASSADGQACGARATAQCQVGVLAAHEQTARPPASECLARSRQYSPSVLHVSYRPRRDWELGSHARLPHTEPYILFVIIFEPLIEPGSQLLARSSSTTPCPPARICLALPRLADLLYLTPQKSSRTPLRWRRSRAADTTPGRVGGARKG